MQIEWITDEGVADLLVVAVLLGVLEEVHDGLAQPTHLQALCAYRRELGGVYKCYECKRKFKLI